MKSKEFLKQISTLINEHNQRVHPDEYRSVVEIKDLETAFDVVKAILLMSERSSEDVKKLDEDILKITQELGLTPEELAKIMDDSEEYDS